MAKLYVDTIAPEGATTNLAIGEAGQDVILPGNDIRANVLQDAGGNAIFTSDGSGNVTGVNSAIGAPKVLILSQTATDGASLSFTSDLDSTYKEYIFYFINIAPATDQANFTFQCSTDGGSNYNTTITNTYFRAKHNEANTEEGLAYDTGGSNYEVTTYISLGEGLGNEADENSAGELHLFNPASTSYVKNFYTTLATSEFSPGEYNTFQGGYVNTTSAVNAISFKMSSGNFDGTIKMYGVK